MQNYFSIQLLRVVKSSLWLTSNKIPRTMRLFILFLICSMSVSSTLAVSNIRNRAYTNCEVYLIDYGYGDFKEKIHFME